MQALPAQNLGSVEHPRTPLWLPAAAVITPKPLVHEKDQVFLFTIVQETSLRYSSEYPRWALVSPGTVDGMMGKPIFNDSPEQNQEEIKPELSFMTISRTVCYDGSPSTKNIILNSTKGTFCLRN